jgi:hypothetical protein
VTEETVLNPDSEGGNIIVEGVLQAVVKTTILRFGGFNEEQFDSVLCVAA